VVTHASYPNRYAAGSSCKWYLQAPVGYSIDLKCSYNLDNPLDYCESQTLYINREGDRELNNPEYFCGYSNFTRSSVGNEFSLAYTSNAGGSGWFYCQATAVATTQANCQCGWTKGARIVGGSYALPNEFVSYAALVDSTKKNDPEGPIFSGAAISKRSISSYINYSSFFLISQ